MGIESVKLQKTNINEPGTSLKWRQIVSAIEKKAPDEDTRKKAEALGIEWTRPSGDNRSAKYIIENDPMLRDLIDRKGGGKGRPDIDAMKDNLKKLVGDYEHDSDAAYRASQVLDHIEKFDSGGNRNSGKDVGNGRIDGITDSGEVRHGTEAGRLKDLGKYGFESLKGDLKKTSAEWGDPKAREQAARLGINWVHPQGDKRSAREIIDDSPLLKNLGNQNGVKDRLKERVGDFDRDADAAFRAVQVLEHIEKYNENGKSISGGDIGNGKIDGFTKGGEAKHGTEAGRLQDFGKYGFDNLKRELPRRPDPKHDEAARKEAEALGIKWERPKGDERSAKEIVDDNPLLKNLGNQGHVKDMLKERVDDFDRDADAAFRAAQVLRHIEKFDGNGNIQDGKNVGNNKIDGFTGGDEAKHGTEAGRLQDFGKQGFKNLKGNLDDAPAKKKDGSLHRGSPADKDTKSRGIADEDKMRKEAEALGIKWTVPNYDKRSASEIIDNSPLLKNLGNQSGVKDMLKDRVGDFENDRDAAYRAVQVLERIEKYDANGKMQSGDQVGNGKIDGFTKSGEAKHGTEAGRLQDFGKYGFSSLAGVGNSYNDYLKTNKNADDASKIIAKYGSILYENFDAIKGATGAKDSLTLKDIQKFKDENPKLMSDDLRKALDFWTKPGSFDILETSHNKLRNGSDGHLSKKDISDWLKNDAPKDAKEAMEFIVRAADGNAVAGVDVKKFDDEIFKNPGKYSAQEKAAVVRDLQKAYDLVGMGKQVGMWDKDHVKKKLSDRAGVGGDPAAVMAEIKQRIDILKKDPEVVKFLNETGEKTLKDFVGSDKDLKNALTGIYDKDIKSGAALDKSWKPGAGPTENLANFFQTGKMYQAALGLDNAKALQDAVKNSKHNGELQDFYEKKMVSGDRFKDLLKDHTPEEAISTFSLEVGLYNAALDPDFTGKHDKKLNENFTSIAKDGAFNGATAQDLQKAFGINGGKDLDEKKVREMIDEIGKTNPELLVNQDGTKAKPDQILTAFRGQWEALRQGTKGGGAYGLIDANNSAKRLFDKGIQHGVSGLLLAGITIAKGIGGSGHLTDRNKVDIAIGSFQTAAILAEGGVKNYRDFLKKAGFDPKTIGDPKSFNEFLQKNASRFEFGLRGVGGGLAGLALGAYNIFDGVKAIRNGDVATGAVNITTGSLGLLGASAVTVEGGMGALGYVVPRLIQGLGAGFGVAGGVLSLASTFILTAINESKASSLQNDYADLLGDYLKKYNIDGKPGDKA